MNLGGGSATVRGGTVPAGIARVSGTVTYALARPSVRRDAGDISLHCPFIDTGNCGLSARVDIPAATALRLATGGGDLTASGLTGTATLRSDGGAVTVAGASGDLTITSGGGDVSVSRVTAPHVSISADGGSISGTIGAPRGATASGPAVTANSGGGEVTLTFTTIPAGLHVKADGGSVTIVVPPGPYIVSTDTDGGNLAHTISPTAGAKNVIQLSSGGGDISLSESPSH